MARYFFNVFNRAGHLIDEEGQEVPDIESARQRALASIRSIIAAEAIEGRIDLQGFVEVIDGEGVEILVVDFRDAFDLNLPDET